MKLNQILIIGDNPGEWHPLEPVKHELEEILEANFQLTFTQDYNDLSVLDPGSYAAIISYADIWSRELTSEQKAGLLRFVASGGGLLVIHNGISLAGSYELLQVVGAKFVSHPPYQPLSYYKALDGHPLVQGVEDFTVDEEPYQFEFDPFTPRTVFLEFEFEGTRYPASWEHQYGLGKVVYLQPGHCAESFKPKSFRRLILNCARWTAGLEEHIDMGKKDSV
ncbi:ThuA domain-containing protein [Paenibacillus tarimensis]